MFWFSNSINFVNFDLFARILLEDKLLITATLDVADGRQINSFVSFN